MAGHGGVADAHLGDFREGRLEGGEKLGLHLAVQILPGIVIAHVAGDVGVEKDGVGDAVAVFAEAAHGDVHIQADPGVYHPEGNGGGGAVFVAHQLLGVEVIHPLVLGRLAAEGETLADVLEHILDALTQASAEDGGLGGEIIDVLAGLGAQVHHLALLHDDHALAVGHGDDGAVGDDVVAALGVGGTAGDPLEALGHQHFGFQRFTIEVFFPLVGQNAAGGSSDGFDQSHRYSLLSSFMGALAPDWWGSGCIIHDLAIVYNDNREIPPQFEKICPIPPPFQRPDGLRTRSGAEKRSRRLLHFSPLFDTLYPSYESVGPRGKTPSCERQII